MLPATFELHVHPGGAITTHPARSRPRSTRQHAGQSQPSGIAVYPIAGAPRDICAGYGARVYADGTSKLHDACDLCAPTGTPAVAVNDGTVSYGTDPFGGNVAILQTADGTAYYYAHLLDVQTEQRSVRVGEQIGRVDTTGNAALGGIPHVHFQVWPGGAFQQGTTHPDPTSDLMAAKILGTPAGSTGWIAALITIGVGLAAGVGIALGVDTALSSS